MCEKLLTRAQAREMLRQGGLTEWRIRLVLDDQIPAHPHELHTRKLWLKSRVKSWLDARLKSPHSGPVVPGEECRPSGVTTLRP